MTTLSHQTRRQILLMAGAIVATRAATAASAQDAPDFETGPQDLAQLQVSRFWRHLDSARAVGRLYAESAPDCGVLLEDLRRVVADEALNTDIETFRQTVTKLIADDFNQGRVLDVNGWTMSRTEIALCVSAAMTGALAPEASGAANG